MKNNILKIDEILKFWFEETSAKEKFQKNDDFDETIRSRFMSVYDDIITGNTIGWSNSAKGILAQIIVLDQFSRNMFRGNKKSFEYDYLALELAMKAVKNSLDQQLPYEQRVFIYMPYMHSESQEVHKHALKIFTDYGNEINLNYEIEHKNIIDTFGRYPHRNKILGRESTPEELEFLKTHSGF